MITVTTVSVSLIQDVYELEIWYRVDEGTIQAFSYKETPNMISSTCGEGLYNLTSLNIKQLVTKIIDLCSNVFNKV